MDKDLNKVTLDNWEDAMIFNLPMGMDVRCWIHIKFYIDKLLKEQRERTANEVADSF